MDVEVRVLFWAPNHSPEWFYFAQNALKLLDIVSARCFFVSDWVRVYPFTSGCFAGMNRGISRAIDTSICGDTRKDTQDAADRYENPKPQAKAKALLIEINAPCLNAHFKKDK